MAYDAQDKQNNFWHYFLEFWLLIWLIFYHNIPSIIIAIKMVKWDAIQTKHIKFNGKRLKFTLDLMVFINDNAIYFLKMILILFGICVARGDTSQKDARANILLTLCEQDIN